VAGGTGLHVEEGKESEILNSSSRNEFTMLCVKEKKYEYWREYYQIIMF
jgi:hypothetical protein